MSLEGFTQVAQGLSGAASAAGQLYNVFGYNPKSGGGGLDLRNSVGSLSGGQAVNAGGQGGPRGLSFKEINTQAPQMSSGASFGGGGQGQLSREHYAKLLEILGVPRG